MNTNTNNIHAEGIFERMMYNYKLWARDHHNAKAHIEVINACFELCELDLENPWKEESVIENVNAETKPIADKTVIVTGVAEKKEEKPWQNKYRKDDK